MMPPVPDNDPNLPPPEDNHRSRLMTALKVLAGTILATVLVIVVVLGLFLGSCFLGR